MRRTLGALLLAVLLVASLAGCGDDDFATEQEVEPQVVAILSGTAVGGTVSPTLTPLPGPDELKAFTEQFDDTAFRDEVATTVQSHEPDEGNVVGAAVVAIGCDVPPGVSVEADDGGYVVRPHKVADPLPECFAPVTSVAVIEVAGS